MMNIKEVGFNNNQGVLLVMTMFAIALLSTLIIGFLLIITTDLSISRSDVWSRQAVYAAEAGLMESLYQLTLNPDWVAGFSTTSLTTDQTYSVSISNQNPFVTLTSTGIAHGYTRIIQSQVAITHQLSSGSYHLRLDTWEEL